MTCYAIILAGGSGTRVGGEEPKQFVHIAGRPMLAYTLAAFEKCDPIDGIVIVGPVDRLDTCEALSRQMGCRKVKDVVVGGVERQDSVQCGMDALPANVDFVAVHDGARPLVDPEDITRVIAAANETGAAVLGTPTSDTVKRVIDGRVQETLEYLGILKRMHRAEARCRAGELLERLDMHEHRNKKVAELSKGMSQLIQTASTMMHPPRCGSMLL